MTVELDGFLCGVDAHDNYSNTYKIFFFHFLFLFDGCLEFGMPYTFLKIDRINEYNTFEARVRNQNPASVLVIYS